MTRIIQNLRIGTKLAIASALNILLMGLIIYMEMTGSATVRNAYESAVMQQSIAEYAAEEKASVRGMQVGLRDILLATAPADLQKATGYFAEREKSAVKLAKEMLKLSRSAENRERIARIATLIPSFAKGKEGIVATRSEIISLEAKRIAGRELPADATVRISEISSTIASAVEEQGAATQEISRNVQQASQGTSQVASNITDVQRGSSETGSASSQVLSAAQSLSVESNRLKTEVQKFLSTVRAA